MTTQEMLKKNILASNLIYINIHHRGKILNKYKNELEKIFINISSKNIKKLLNNKVCFKPINRIN